MLEFTQHSKLIRKIESIIKEFNRTKIGSVDYWVESSYIDAKGERRKEYLVSKNY